MPITPLGRYYNITNVIKVYNHENGDVYVTHSDKFYAVHIIKQTSANGEEYITRGRLDALATTEFFQVAVRYMRGGTKMPEPVRKFSCKYNPKKTLVCTDKNCPEKLGGIDYRTIFGVACPFRKAR